MSFQSIDFFQNQDRLGVTKNLTDLWSLKKEAQSSCWQKCVHVIGKHQT